METCRTQSSEQLAGKPSSSGRKGGKAGWGCQRSSILLSPSARAGSGAREGENPRSRAREQRPALPGPARPRSAAPALNSSGLCFSHFSHLDKSNILFESSSNYTLGFGINIINTFSISKRLLLQSEPRLSVTLQPRVLPKKAHESF